MALMVTDLVGFMAGGAPPPPFSFRAAYTNNTGLTTYTFSSCDLGTPNPARMNVVAVAAWAVGQSVSSVTIDGVAATSVGSAVAFDNTRISIWYAPSTANPTGDVVVTFTGAAVNCAVGVYAGYPASQTPVDVVNATGSGATLVLTDLAKTSGGFTILAGHKVANGTATYTQNGAETITEDADANLGSATYNYGSHINTATTTADDYTLTWSAGGTNAGFLGATWA